MSEPTLDDLRVTTFAEGGFSVNPGEGFTRPLTPAEFDRIARERGYVKRPVCGNPRCDNGELTRIDTSMRGTSEPIRTGDPCPSCGGTGFGRLVALDGIDVALVREEVGDLRHYPRDWPGLLGLGELFLAVIDQEAT